MDLVHEDVAEADAEQGASAEWMQYMRERVQVEALCAEEDGDILRSLEAHSLERAYWSTLSRMPEGLCHLSQKENDEPMDIARPETPVCEKRSFFGAAPMPLKRQRVPA